MNFHLSRIANSKFRLALFLSALVIAWELLASYLTRQVVDERLQLVRGQVTEKSFTVPLTSRYVVFLDISRSNEIDSVLDRKDGSESPAILTWRVSKDDGTDVASSVSSLVASASYTSDDSVGNRIGEFDAIPNQRYELNAKVLSDVPQLRNTETRLVIRLERDGFPGSSTLLPRIWQIWAVMRYLLLPTALLLWLFWFLDHNKTTQRS